MTLYACHYKQTAITINLYKQVWTRNIPPSKWSTAGILGPDLVVIKLKTDVFNNLHKLQQYVLSWIYELKQAIASVNRST